MLFEKADDKDHTASELYNYSLCLINLGEYEKALIKLHTAARLVSSSGEGQTLSLSKYKNIIAVFFTKNDMYIPMNPLVLDMLPAYASIRIKRLIYAVFSAEDPAKRKNILNCWKTNWE